MRKPCRSARAHWSGMSWPRTVSTAAERPSVFRSPRADRDREDEPCDQAAGHRHGPARSQESRNASVFEKRLCGSWSHAEQIRHGVARTDTHIVDISSMSVAQRHWRIVETDVVTMPPGTRLAPFLRRGEPVLV